MVSEENRELGEKNRELGNLALWIKRDGHKKGFANQETPELGDSRIRRDDCIWKEEYSKVDRNVLGKLTNLVLHFYL